MWETLYEIWSWKYLVLLAVLLALAIWAIHSWGATRLDWNKLYEIGIWKYLVFLVALVGLAFLINGVLGYFKEGIYGLPALALSGVVILLGSLLVFTTLLNAIGLSDKNQALGLPEGSVRAMLALALLGMFAILASSVSLPQPQRRDANGLRAEDVTALIKNNPDAHDIVQKQELAKEGQPPTFQVTFYSTPRQDDFAKQMLTLVGTLMTSVISFYFATTTARTAAGSEPRPTGVSPATASAGAPTTFTIAGTGLGGVTRVEAVPSAGGSVIPAAVISSTDTEIKCNLTLTVGDWTIQVVSGTAAPVAVPNKITVS